VAGPAGGGRDALAGGAGGAKVWFKAYAPEKLLWRAKAVLLLTE